MIRRPNPLETTSSRYWNTSSGMRGAPVSALYPPSTVMIATFMKAYASEANNNSVPARSSGLPIRPSAVRFSQ
jgi:hypothetical protein